MIAAFNDRVLSPVRSFRMFFNKISTLEPAYALKKNFVGVIFGAQKVDLNFFWKFKNFQ